MKTLTYERITPDVPMLGLTGPLGSGCSFLAERLQRDFRYYHVKLSGVLTEEATKRGWDVSTVAARQNAGDRLRAENGDDYLAAGAVVVADKAFDPKNYDGVVFDGIRNLAEAYCLRQLPQFYLISVYADHKRRMQRLMRSGKVHSQEEFGTVDKRDADGKSPHGQQVSLCAYYADIIIVNDSEQPVHAHEMQKGYVNDKLYGRYITMIHHLARNEELLEHYATTDEALMTAAYCQSRRSLCLKRKVGAIIANAKGEILAGGYNEAPDDERPCLLEPRYNWCFRDIIQEAFAARIKVCPTCGTKVLIEAKCANCNAPVSKFLKRCPTCGTDPQVEYVCSGCGTDIFPSMLPGAGGEGGKLLDMCRALHAEEAALLSLARAGVHPPNGSVIYTTTFPCNMCAKKILAMETIRRVVFAEPYPQDEAWEMFEKHGIDIVPFQGVKTYAFFRVFS